MTIETKELGFVEIENQDIIKFPHAIYGFENAKNFVLLKDTQKESNPFMWLQCVDAKEPCFAVIDPYSIFNDYAPQPSIEALQSISLKTEEFLRYLVIATVPEQVKDLYVNLKCPVVINSEDNIAMQVILENSDYNMRYYLFKNVEG